MKKRWILIHPVSKELFCRCFLISTLSILTLSLISALNLGKIGLTITQWIFYCYCSKELEGKMRKISSSNLDFFQKERKTLKGIFEFLNERRIFLRVSLKMQTQCDSFAFRSNKCWILSQFWGRPDAILPRKVSFEEDLM